MLLKRLLKLVLWTAVLFVALAGVSYVGARARVAMFLGSPLPELGERVITFNVDGIPEFVGNPRAWTFTYGPGLFPGTPQIQVFVSPTGRLIGTRPRDLQTRIAQYQEALLNP